MSEKGGRNKAGLFIPGNKIWLMRSSHGRKPIFAGPDDLWSACVEYFEWSHDNPLYEAKAFANGTTAILPKMRAMTLHALCEFIGIDRKTWAEWRARSDLSPVTSRVDDILYAQKFEGAAADLLNPNIIARDLGLADKSEAKIDAGEGTLLAVLDKIGKEAPRL